jgi:hypothetical protein
LLTFALVAGTAVEARAQAAQHRLFAAQQDDPAHPGVAVHLDYVATEGCPAENELHEIVAARMGYDPFTPTSAPAQYVLRIAISRQVPSFVGAVELRDTAGSLLWSRPPLAESDCRRLASVIGGVTVTIAIDTASTQAAAAVAAPVAPIPIAPAPPPPEAPPPSSPTPRPAFRLGVRAAGAVGVGAAPTAAFTVDLGAGWRLWSIAVEGRADVPTTGSVSMGVSARTSVLAASLVPCGHYGWFVGCGLVSAGVLRAEGVNVLHAAQDEGVYFAAGVRAGIEWPIVPAFALRASADVLVNLHPLAAQVDFDAGRDQVWKSGPFAALFGGGLVARFGGGS